MPKDPRIWMTFPIDFWMHPKIRPLSDAAFRTFVEINGFSRMQDLDGRIPQSIARTMWKPRPLAELLANHPERPSLTLEGDEYVIWNYSEHQDTRADREARQARNAENGRKGGRPRNNPAATDSVTDSVSNSNRAATDGEPNSKQSQSQSQESEDLTDITHEPQSSPVSNARAVGRDGFNEIVLQKAQRAGIRNLSKLYALLSETVSGRHLSPAAAVEFAQVIAERSKHPVENIDAYVAAACRKSPEDVQHWYDTCDLGVA